MKFLLILTIITFTTSYTHAAMHSENKTQDPITIESNELIINREQSKGTFLGDVVVIQGDMTINAGKMIVHYIDTATDLGSSPTLQPDDNASLINQEKISKIELLGDVLMTTPKEKAKGDYGEYTIKDKIMVLKGNVRLMQGKNILTGEKFIYNRLTGKGILTADQHRNHPTKRAKALINSEGVK